MLTAKQARKLASDPNLIKNELESYSKAIKEAAEDFSQTEVYTVIPRNSFVFDALKKELTKNGFKYNITKDNILLIKW